MIKKSLLACLVMLVGYNVSLRFLPDRYRLDPTGGHYNVLIAEEYLCSAHSDSMVVVGTSLAQMLGPLGDDCYNLAFGAGSSITGLEVLRRSGAAPPVVAIEMNYFHNPLDRGFVDRLFLPVFFTLRQHFPMFREKYRPANYVAGITSASLEATKNILKGEARRHARTEVSGNTAEPEPTAPQSVLEINQKEFERLPDATAVAQAAAILAEKVKLLEARGCTCVFFEMPTDPALSNSKQTVALRNAARECFPSSRCHWIPADSQHQHQTRDGTHLTTTSAGRYARFLKEQLRAVAQSKSHILMTRSSALQ